MIPHNLTNKSLGSKRKHTEHSTPASQKVFLKSMFGQLGHGHRLERHATAVNGSCSHAFTAVDATTARTDESTIHPRFIRKVAFKNSKPKQKPPRLHRPSALGARNHRPPPPQKHPKTQTLRRLRSTRHSPLGSARAGFGLLDPPHLARGQGAAGHHDLPRRVLGSGGQDTESSRNGSSLGRKRRV